MRMTEKIERFFNLDEKEKEILEKASDILSNMGRAIEGLGKFPCAIQSLVNRLNRLGLMTKESFSTSQISSSLFLMKKELILNKKDG